MINPNIAFRDRNNTSWALTLKFITDKHIVMDCTNCGNVFKVLVPKHIAFRLNVISCSKCGGRDWHWDWDD